MKIIKVMGVLALIMIFATAVALYVSWECGRIMDSRLECERGNKAACMDYYELIRSRR